VLKFPTPLSSKTLSVILKDSPMEFDITHIDRKILVRALLVYAEPVGYGAFEYENRKAKKQNIDGLTDKECEDILFDYENMEIGHKRVLDYYRGKPLKIDFYKKENGQMFANSNAYDERNGKYRFFEALLDFIIIDEIKILRKNYGENDIIGQPEHIYRPNEIIKELKKIIDNCEVHQDEFGKYWSTNPSFKYDSGIKKFLGI
jgi:hypothetical protein